MSSNINPRGVKVKRVFSNFITKEIILIFGILVIAGIFGIVEPIFLSTTNIFNMFRAIAALGIVSLGVGLVMMLGEIDFSVGALIGLGGGSPMDAAKAIAPPGKLLNG